MLTRMIKQLKADLLKAQQEADLLKSRYMDNEKNIAETKAVIATLESVSGTSHQL